MSDEKPPDFAMSRAAEILFQLYERQVRPPAEAPPPPMDKVVVLFNETIAFDVTKTMRADVERALGIAFSYPARGWHTYCVKGQGGREFVSLFYAKRPRGDAALVSAELYLPKADYAPALEPRNLGSVRFVPGEFAIGMQVASLSASFGRIPKPPGLGPYDDIFEARFPGGSAYAMGAKGVVERLAIYALA
ncbi:MAG: hypothetical protein JO199_12185 [Candidatus Eremiobacteraeota bacterium]|nr:hypothetical protein [Candidatus Eremiobacteraeota bacterium]